MKLKEDFSELLPENAVGFIVVILTTTGQRVHVRGDMSVAEICLAATQVQLAAQDVARPKRPESPTPGVKNTLGNE